MLYLPGIIILNLNHDLSVAISEFLLDLLRGQSQPQSLCFLRLPLDAVRS